MKTWVHRGTGKKYRLLHIANEQAEAARKDEFPPLAVYMRMSDSSVWARPLADFHEKFVELESDPIVYRGVSPEEKSALIVAFYNK